MNPLFRLLLFIVVIWAVIRVGTDGTAAADGERLRIGVYENKPLVFKGEDGQVRGFVIDFLDQVARKEGWTLTYDYGLWKAQFQAVRDGALDLLGPIAYSAERDAFLDFNKKNLLTNWGEIFTNREDMRSLIDLDDRIIGYIKGDIYHQKLLEILKSFKVEPVFRELDSYRAIIDAIDAGALDGGILSRLAGQMLAAETRKVRTTGIVFHPINIVFATAEGRHQAVLQQIDAHLTTLKAEKGGPYGRLMNKWFGGGGSGGEKGLPDWFVPAVGGGGLVILLLVFGNVWLNNLVRSKTRSLEEEIERRQQAAAHLSALKKDLEQRVLQRTAELERSNKALMEEIHVRRRIEEALKKSEKRFRTLFESSTDAVMLLDRETFLDCNPAALALFGVPDRETFVRLHPSDLSPKTLFEGQDARKLADVRIESAFREGHALFEWVHRRQDTGVDFPAEVLLTPMEMEGKPILHAIVRDIGERKAAETALRKSQAELEALFNAMPDLVLILDREGRYLDISAESQGLLFRPSQELIGQRLHDVFPREQADFFLQKVHQSLDGHEAVSLIYSLEIAGKESWFDGRISPLSEDRIVFVARDVTTTKLQMTLLEKVLANIPNQIFWKDRNLNYLGCNTQFAEVVGLEDPQAIVGRSDYDMHRDSTHVDHYRAWDRKIMNSGEAVIDLEERYHNADGKEGTVLTSKVPLRNDAGEVFGLLGICTDITDLKNSQLELKRARDAAESANRAKSVFLATMSHEIRTPMDAIMGLCNLALSTELPHLQRDYLEKIDQSARSMLGIIDDILDFSKIEAGKLEIERVAFDLDELVGQVASVTTIAAENKGLTFLLDIADTVPRALAGDPKRLRQILNNLTSNAVKFTQEGSIAIKIMASDTTDRTTVLQFEIRDTGLGIAAADQKKLFKEFSQVDASITRRFGGTGLGLAICQRLVRLMDGSIEVDSLLGQGSTFRFTLPFGLADPADIRRAGDLTPTEFEAEVIRDSRILLVEDTVLLQEITSRILERQGLQIEVAGNGLEAVDRIDAMPPDHFDLVLMDLEMPVLDGYQAAEIIRITHPDLPIIAMTAHAMAEHRQACLDVGMNDHVSKPIDVGRLWELMVKWLSFMSKKTTGMSKKKTGMSKKTTGSGAAGVGEDGPILPPTLPGFDIEAGIARVDGDRELFASLLQQFPQWAETHAQGLRKAWENGDYDEVSRAAHTLRGTAAAATAVDLQAAAAALENAVVEGRTTDLEPLVAEIDRTLARAIEALKALA